MVLEQLRLFMWNFQTKIIALTSYDSKSSANMIDVGAVSYLIKKMQPARIDYNYKC
jgi:CheY-like chemotaxis protein